MTNLPVPTPASEVPGNFVTGALWNANVCNGLLFLLNPPIFTGVQTVVQSIPNTTWTTISLDTTQVDTYGGHSTVTNTSRYVAQVAGYYSVCGVAVIDSNATSARGARITKNGGIVQGAASFYVPPSANAAAVPTPIHEVYLNVGDYVELQVWQGSGGNMNTGVYSDITSKLWARWSHF
jgi:hypothetical protein